MTMRDRSAAAKKGWARRRLTHYLTAIRKYLGHTPDQVRIFSEDFDLLNGKDNRIDLIRGPSKPPPEGKKTPIHH